ncbi:uncharacterized protein BXZ73DRAFT_98286 [Epithele typhae]|uniref:uncharacterized protein n=1 Tax=Epithele typhae TaxID=378194 RepID=UPI0020078DAE|nr:uncharacterized protein BXZ73DRAFT_98286 [Epithele typhae]KAH9941897.1 hypothetical protein BXZ73DRAFT_98286 [Epithele typhae]
MRKFADKFRIWTPGAKRARHGQQIKLDDRFILVNPRTPSPVVETPKPPQPPILRIPPPVLAEIFAIVGAMSPSWDCRLDCGVESCRHPSKPWTGMAWVYLMLVCSSWRKAGADSPELWRRISIHLDKDTLQYRLARAAPSTVDIILSFDPKVNLSHCAMLLAEASRIRSIQAPPHSSLKAFSSIAPLLCDVTLPELKALEIWLPYWYWDQQEVGDEVEDGDRDAEEEESFYNPFLLEDSADLHPKLSEVLITGIALPMRAEWWKRLRFLYIEHPLSPSKHGSRASDLALRLTFAERLVRLVINAQPGAESLLNPTVPPASWTPEAFSLYMLRDLRIKATHEYTSTLLKYLRTPRIKALVLETSEYDTKVVDSKETMNDYLLDSDLSIRRRILSRMSKLFVGGYQIDEDTNVVYLSDAFIQYPFGSTIVDSDQRFGLSVHVHSEANTGRDGTGLDTILGAIPNLFMKLIIRHCDHCDREEEEEEERAKSCAPPDEDVEMRDATTTDDDDDGELPEPTMAFKLEEELAELGFFEDGLFADMMDDEVEEARSVIDVSDDESSGDEIQITASHPNHGDHRVSSEVNKKITELFVLWPPVLRYSKIPPAQRLVEAAEEGPGHHCLRPVDPYDPATNPWPDIFSELSVLRSITLDCAQYDGDALVPLENVFYGLIDNLLYPNIFHAHALAEIRVVAAISHDSANMHAILCVLEEALATRAEEGLPPLEKLELLWLCIEPSPRAFSLGHTKLLSMRAHRFHLREIIDRFTPKKWKILCKAPDGSGEDLDALFEDRPTRDGAAETTEEGQSFPDLIFKMYWRACMEGVRMRKQAE